VESTRAGRTAAAQGAGGRRGALALKDDGGSVVTLQRGEQEGRQNGGSKGSRRMARRSGLEGRRRLGHDALAWGQRRWPRAVAVGGGSVAASGAKGSFEPLTRPTTRAVLG
jgi:hypothetical protein